MAHFAKISEDNEVLTVVVLNDSNMLNAEGVEDEETGKQYLETNNNWPKHLWIQTSYNTFKNQHTHGGTALRGNYAGTGNTWDEANNIFWPEKTNASWVKHLPTASWKSPIGDAPTLTAEQEADTENDYVYKWNESGQSWDIVIIPIL